MVEVPRYCAVTFVERGFFVEHGFFVERGTDQSESDPLFTIEVGPC